MKRYFLKLAASAALLGALVIPQAAFAAAPAPSLHDDNPSGKFGDWYTGAVPANADTSKPVILFVQGLHSDYTTWYNSGDDYYDAAFNAGYRTAFVQLKDADGGGGDMWTNGSALADVIRKVSAYYGGAKINIIAHSKGGIDTQTALDYYGAYPYVNVVHQLSTPNRGSELADLSYGSWTWWLGWIMGQQDDAVYSLQTSYMSNFRSWTDGLTENNYTRTYMSNGTGDDGWFSAYWYAHAVLPGSDDGAVAQYSALGLPNGIYSFTDNGSEKLSHTAMRYASKTWWQVRPKLTSTTFAALPTPSLSASANKTQLEGGSIVIPPEYSSNLMLGGTINGLTSNTFSLESGLNSTTVDVMTASSATDVELVAPSGNVYKPSKAQSVGETAMMFDKASHNVFNISKPEKGTWTMRAAGTDDAYFLLAQLDGGPQAKVTTKKKQLNAKKDLTTSFTLNLEGGKGKTLVTNGKLVAAKKQGGHNSILSNVEIKQDASGAYNAVFATPTTPGVYNVSFDVTGVKDNGEEFTRSVNYNFAVTDESGSVK
ncbi:esterase/lipase family protein [Tumebacillus amylolyticus]|uniref:esterase/lipase family protein n=1 Tax=Tumebacillus amylolyticus TaxID=2801339 RepID=UPI003221BB3B